MNNNNELVFDYVQLEGNGVEDNDNNNIIALNQFFLFEDEFVLNQEMNHDQLRTPNQIYESIITMKSSYAIIRLCLLYVFFYLDEYKLTPFLLRIIAFLLVHEAIVISNCFTLKSFLYLKRLYNPNTREYPILCSYIDIIGNFVFFSWLCYSVCYIMTDTPGLELSLNKNLLMTYYVAILVLIGFFTFSRVIFYILFFISFCPCLFYVYCSDLHEEYLVKQKAKRLKELLKEVPYSDYIEKTGFEETTCIICTEDFKCTDLVIKLPCNLKHVFHEDCIKAWIEKKPICPICRGELNPDNIN